MPPKKRGNARGKGRGGGRGGSPAKGGGAGKRSPIPYPWDSVAHAARIDANFAAIRAEVVDAALNGVRPSSQLVLELHAKSLAGVPLAERWVSGHYRGQAPRSARLATYGNQIGGIPGEPAARVMRRVRETFAELESRLDDLDEQCRQGASLADVYYAVLDVVSWLHGEWIRIHPLADHNGSMARLLALMVGLRYGLPIDLPGKPRSALATAGLLLDYELAAQNQMAGDDALMVTFLHKLITHAAP